ncbi:type IV toxin-antitoxin system AbiEi family antitoxin domain-containing protein [Promicromonospora sp. NPDC057138]|uniref:type IV toxin-antitoxin system AbiEi family antitoxin domain-containing protein n=1 Tax=Promicromonospora sp. NPDC057138 TaxID=3346031 RepID=UPI00362EF901
MPREMPVPPQLLSLARRQGGLVSAAQCEAAGVGASRRRNLVARGRWQRVTRGVFDAGGVPAGLHPYDVDRLRSVWSALLANRRAIAVGACALMLHGVEGLPRRLVPEAALPRGAAGRSPDGFVLRQYGPTPKTVEIQGREVVLVEQALVQALPTLTRDEAVACLDNALNQGLIRTEQLETIGRRLRRRRDSAKVTACLPLIDGRAEAPPESHARMRLHDAGIAPDDLQREFFDATGRFLGRADMVWYLGDDRWLIVEIDSQEFHGSERQVQHDAIRQNRLLADGQNIMLRYFPADLDDQFTEGVAKVLEREAWKPGRQLPPRRPAAGES